MGEGVTVRLEILKLDESCIGDSRLESSNWTQAVKLAVQSAISNLESRIPFDPSSFLRLLAEA